MGVISDGIITCNVSHRCLCRVLYSATVAGSASSLEVVGNWAKILATGGVGWLERKHHCGLGWRGDVPSPVLVDERYCIYFLSAYFGFYRSLGEYYLFHDMMLTFSDYIPCMGEPFWRCQTNYFNPWGTIAPLPSSDPPVHSKMRMVPMYLLWMACTSTCM